MQKLSIQEMIVLAELKGGKCLSTEYVNYEKKLKWQCVNGHIWEARPRRITSDKKWCPICVI